jgi:hypothetical protein
VGDV